MGLFEVFHYLLGRVEEKLSGCGWGEHFLVGVQIHGLVKK